MKVSQVIQKIPNSVSSKVGRSTLLSQKHAPTVLFGLGVLGTIGSTVLACRATLKLDEIVGETENNLSLAHRMSSPQYSETDRQGDVALIYVKSTTKIVKLYAPSVALGVVSIGALTASHNILQNRNAALAAAYLAVDKAFTEYRERVVEKYGHEEDLKLRYEMEAVEVTNEETGKKEKLLHATPGAASMYARFFDEYSSSWSKEPEYNLLFLKCQQNYANDLLKSRGHVFLNEVYDMLGIKRSQAGSVVGWVISRDGDNYIDFGMFDADNSGSRDFINGREGSILLDFNVDGVIYDKIENHKRGEISWQR